MIRFSDLRKHASLAIIHLFNRFPIQHNKIFLFSYYGSQYGGNPKYISESILRSDSVGHFDIVWAFNDLKSKQHLSGFRKVKTLSLRYFYDLCTAKVVITNFRTTDLFVKRKEQYYIQTWHSSLRLKQIEKDAEDVLTPDYIQMAKRDSQKCDLLLSGCQYSSEIFKRAFWYDGEIFEHGTPRNDVLFEENKSKKKEILKALKIPGDYRVILYAPTFRKGDRLDVYNLDYQAILEKLASRFGGEWIFLVKWHPHLLPHSDQLVTGGNVVNVTTYDDVQELLSIADVLISDYSSLMFDFAITRRPCFLYVPDFHDYIDQDRKLYFDLMELPFISVKTNGELIEEIGSYDQKKYRKQLLKFLERVGSFEDGKAGEHLVRHIKEVCSGQKNRRIIDEAI